MRVYILGIAGTFMGGLAQVAKSMGFDVAGVDKAVYPPMSDQLAQAGIDFDRSYEAHCLATESFDYVIVGNAISRGNVALEYALDNDIPYCSAPQWFAEHVLAKKHVLAVAGTHGKTTTSSMLAWILEYVGKQPGFLIGGVPENFGVSARLGNSDYFVIEADEYDSAFCDKRSKFVHYRPKTLVINNIEFDHADIFNSLQDIQKQFHQVVRTVPSTGAVLSHASSAVDEVLQMGCWSRHVDLSGPNSHWQVIKHNEALNHFSVVLTQEDGEQQQGTIEWELAGEHNIQNALSAVAAANDVGITVALACEALRSFLCVKRRMQLIADINGIKVFDDFAHHPTAIRLTLEGVRKRFAQGRILAIVEARSNTMKMGVHDHALLNAFEQADKLWWFGSQDAASLPAFSSPHHTVCFTVAEILQALQAELQTGDHVIIMSNGAFEGIHQQLITLLQKDV